MNESGTSNIFRFKEFAITQDQCAMKVGTDGILLGSWARVGGATQILDIGTGTGLITLMLAQRQPLALLTGIEIDETAAQQAKANAMTSPFADRVEIIQGSVQSLAQKQEKKYDLIISNPPFFSGGVLPDNAGRAEVRHTVKLSHGDLLRSVQQLLQPDGEFYLILPWLEGLRFQELAQRYKLFPQHFCRVSSRPENPPNRLLLAFGNNRVETPESDQLTVYADTEGQKRSADFAALTADFYL